MQLEELQKHWNAFAKSDPFWAILTAPDKENRRWRAEEFFATGKAEVDALIQSVEALNWTGRRRRALDFGCGVGRLTQPLSDHFEQCCGVDISAEMLRLANEFNRRQSRCSYHLNTSNALPLFSDGYFDFIYSNIVLQHMKPEYAGNYIREFLRVLAPGGLIIFQLPSEMVRHPHPASTSMRLPETAFRAAIRPTSVVDTITPSSQKQVAAVVKNVSGFTWPRSSVCLGNHWLSETGKTLVVDDARAELSQDLPPGGEEHLKLRITAPDNPGVYLIELDMVQEGVSWFKQRGSETAVFPVTVQGQQEPEDKGAPGTFNARMEMYGMPLDAVVGIVTQSGGRFLEIKQDYCAGSNWHSYRYCVTKDEYAGDKSPGRYYFREYSTTEGG